jgi:hypothetical protein
VGAGGEVGAEPGVRRCPPSSHAERGRVVGCRRAPARDGVGWGCERRSRPTSWVTQQDELLRRDLQRADTEVRAPATRGCGPGGGGAEWMTSATRRETHLAARRVLSPSNGGSPLHTKRRQAPTSIPPAERCRGAGKFEFLRPLVNVAAA